MFKAKYYDKIYPYPVKHKFVLKYLKGKTIIDIGGGTGLRAELLNKQGYKCNNIEPQKDLADISRKRGIITNTKISEKVDNILMMFHVVNFLDNIEEDFKKVYSNLKTGGRFIFDYWNHDIKKKGFSIEWNGLLTRISYKKWKGNNVIVYFLFPFKLFIEKHKLEVYSDIYKLLKNYKIIRENKTEYETIIVAEKL